MSTVAPAPPDRDPLVWLSPSPLWQQATAGIDEPGFEQPWLVELATDDFVPAFLELLADTTGPGPTGLATLGPSDGSGTFTDPAVLYQPLHGRFYLVAGSLVCRRIGLPDREVAPQGQRVSFVIRRALADGSEQAWLAAAKAWAAVPDATALVDGEEQLPLQTAPLEAPAGQDAMAHLLGLDEPGYRQIHFGYVPVAARAAKREPLADPVAALVTDPDRASGDDARLMEFRLRIAGPWSDIGAKHAINVDIHEPSLYLLLDLRDWLATYLPDVLAALIAGTTLTGAAEILRAKLAINVKVDGTDTAMGQVLADLASYLPLVTGASTTEPSAHYEVHSVPGGLPAYADALAGTGSANGGLVLAALTAPNAPRVGKQTVPAELAHAVVPRPADERADADRHVLRLVYEHEPCTPVLSKPTPFVRFAGPYDPDAPARPIRIEMPDPTNLRKFTRGVAIDMPPALRRTLDRVTPDVLKEKDLGPEGGWQLGMICSFSIQIIMLVAFIVMFIFLILLNIVFWWMAFLKICFPDPHEEVVMTAIGAGDFYGRGFSFPVRVGLDGRLAVSEGERNVRECICVLLRTARTERVERSDFGCALDQYLYDSNDLSTLRLLQEEVKRAITTWEPRVALDDVRVAVNPADPRAVDVTIVYNLVATGAPDRVDATLRG